MTTEDPVHLDVCGACCPLPLIELARAVRDTQPGRTIEVTGNDPIFESSVRDYCQANGHDVVEVRPGERRRVSILIRVGETP